jgi:DNA polymerase I
VVWYNQTVNKKQKTNTSSPKAKERQRKLVLLDSHAIIHRAYHALPDFLNSKGEPTGALYGLATMLFKIITELKPDYIIACYDLPKKTFRHEAYDQYKAGRAKADPALVNQLIKSKDFFKACSIPIYECEGFEADDILGTIVEKTISIPGMDIIIASGDMDTMQLIEENRVYVYTLKKGINDTILYDQKKVMERFGFEPEYLPDYKGLRGDPSDNIIGVKGIGEKTATTLISHYNSIEKIYEALKSNEQEIKKLGITDRIINILKENEDEAVFSKTLATIRRDAPINFTFPEKVWQQTVDKKSIELFFQEMEFKSLFNRLGQVLNEKKEDVVQVTNIETEKYNEFDFRKAQIAYWLLDSEKTEPELQDILNYKNSKNLPEALIKLEQDISKEKLDYVYRQIEIPIIDLVEKMEKEGIRVDKNYLKNLSIDYHKELNKIEKSIWQKAGQEFNINSPKQLGDIIFNKLNLPIKGLKKSAGGAQSTRESELEKLKGLNPIIDEILKYRELQKLLSTYIDTIPLMIDDKERLHSHFIQTGTTTGRFASTNPNLQNIPTKTELGKNIRHAFVAQEGYFLASFDYSQIELRIAALLSQDKYFIEAFNQERDIHQAVAVKVFNVSENEVTQEMRRRAKVINFGILYGMGVNALKQNLGTDRKEAQIFYDNYFDQFPTIATYLESIKEFAKKNGYTMTLFGRKRYFRGISSPIPHIRAMQERMATNAPIQGTATADIIKIGMKNAEEALLKAKLLDKAKLVLQIHDELIFEVKKEAIEEAITVIKKSLENAIPNEFMSNLEPVPLNVHSSYGLNWGELK